ncbi:MAG: transposase [Bdellovibrionaceae bacterium]|jgi:transposase|nr:transposase [Pseudobdellovibrionaceae bacterium]
MFFSDEQWAELCPLLPMYQLSLKGGRPRLDKRKILEGIIFVFQNRIPWKGVPKVYGSGTALNNYFREWAENGVFHDLKEHQFSIIHCLDWDKINAIKKSTEQPAQN